MKIKLTATVQVNALIPYFSACGPIQGRKISSLQHFYWKRFVRHSTVKNKASKQANEQSIVKGTDHMKRFINH